MGRVLSIDGLLPALPPDEHAWLQDAPERSNPTVDGILRTVADIRLMNQIVWPARVDGLLERPPDSHVLDAIVREHLIEGANDEIRNEALGRPEAMTVAVLSESLPGCSACTEGRARYDTSLRAPASGWEMLCIDCYARSGVERLGAGLGQYLLTWSDVDRSIRAAFEVAAAYWSARGVSAPDIAPWCQ